MKPNRRKIGCSIQAVLKVVSAPAHFKERGARCFVGRLGVGRLDEATECFWRSDDLAINLLERDERIVYAVCIAVHRCFSIAADSKMSCRR